MRVNSVSDPLQPRFCAGCHKFHATPGRVWRTAPSRKASEVMVHVCSACEPRISPGSCLVCDERASVRRVPLCADCLSAYEWARLIRTERF